MIATTELPARVARRVIADGDCLVWTGAKNSRGYGTVTNGRGGSMLVHRYVYEQLVGPIPEGLTIDHVAARGCTSKCCVNVEHLEPVTRGENNRRAAALKTHCKKGHALTGDNLAINKRSRGVQRECRTCRSAVARAYRQRVA